MPREPIYSASEPDDEYDRQLRPQRMSDMVGQRDTMDRLQIAIDAASKRDEPLGHVLFDGPPGLGKTTFAICIPKHLGAKLHLANGAGMKAPRDLIPYLTNLEENSVLFIDEIHRVPKVVEEYLYTAMEDYRIDIILGDGINARTINLTIKPFTLIGATTRAGMLSGPLRDRFLIREHLGFYSLEEMTEIVRRSAKKLSVDVDDDAATEIARRARSTPRIANHRLRWVRDFADTKADGRISLDIALAALEMAEIDVLGLDKQDRHYLKTLIGVLGGGPAGVNSVAATMNVSSDTLEDEVEPFLLRYELIVRTPRGRVATPKAFAHLKMPPPEVEGQPQLFDG